MKRKDGRLKLTKKKLKNKRFRKSEEAILMAIFSDHKNKNVGEIMKKIKISRSTFYRHHGSVGGILRDYEKYMTVEFRKRVKKNEAINAGIKGLYWQLLIFLLENKNVVKFSIDKEGGYMIERMLKVIKIENIMEDGRNNVVIEIYKKEIVGIVEAWGKRGFKKDEIESVLEGILFLTKTVGSRLNFFI